ncbi:flagellar protein FlaG [Reinekea sp. G2M2-21]|uniref:flagellar protein FlaG n=1 Tax=Reinekea sp. G2M2-21 TaxID=2788942 RepID=UPI001E64217B|nr:flagellar protein FlaG [Reinekea sp. G2M2-21]
MNEISMQPQLNAKASAPVRDAVKANENDTGKTLVSTVSQAEARKTENTPIGSLLEKAQDQEANNSEVEQAVAKLNDYVQNTQRKLEFQIDDDSGETVVRVYDKHSEELIRQIPNEEALELAKRLNQEEPLMLFSAQV